MNATYVTVSGWVAAIIVTITFIDALITTYQTYFPAGY